MEKPKRKQNRLPDYDYAQNGVYFVTICTKDKRNLFWRKGTKPMPPQNEEDALPLPLSEYGRVVEKGIANIPRCYPMVAVEKYCIMPNHIHMMLHFSDRGRLVAAPTAWDDRRLIAAPTLSRVVGQMKRWISKQIGDGIWQKSFFDRVVRNDAEYEEIWKYIHNNPLKYLWNEELL